MGLDSPELIDEIKRFYHHSQNFLNFHRPTYDLYNKEITYPTLIYPFTKNELVHFLIRRFSAALIDGDPVVGNLKRDEEGKIHLDIKELLLPILSLIYYDSIELKRKQPLIERKSLAHESPENPLITFTSENIEKIEAYIHTLFYTSVEKRKPCSDEEYKEWNRLIIEEALAIIVGS